MGKPSKTRVGPFRVEAPGKSVEDDPQVASLLRRGRRHLRGLEVGEVKTPDLDEDVRRGHHRARGGGGLLSRGSSFPGPLDDDD